MADFTYGDVSEKTPLVVQQPVPIGGVQVAAAAAGATTTDGKKIHHHPNNDDKGTGIINNFRGIFEVSSSSVPVSEKYQDLPEHMTYSRRIAKWLSSNFEWYCPPKARTALNDGWWYYERYTLSRHEGRSTDPDSKDFFVSANAGELKKKTYLYPLFGTPETDLADFGEGIGIYFYTLRMLAIIFLMAGILSLPNILFFASTAWDAQKDARFRFLQASAICSDQIWKACPTCRREDWDFFPASFQSYAEAESATGEVLTFIRTNGCSITREAGIVALLTMVIVSFAIYILSRAAESKEQVLDHSQQTTKDYSLQVKNPPKDARDPQEWKDFFTQFGTVVSVTIVLDNQELLLQLLERRKLISQLEDIVPPEVKIDPVDIHHAVERALPLSRFSKLMGMLSGSEIEERINTIDEKINSDLALRQYEVAEIFVIFNEELDQQDALEQLQIPLVQVYRQNIDALKKPMHFSFRGNVVLNVADPPETSNVIWYNLDDTFFDHLKQRTITFFVTVLFILLSCALVIIVKLKHGSVIGAIAVSVVTSLAPTICQYTIYYGETHPTEESRQLSLFLKTTACLWVTATLLTTRITPFQGTLDDDPADLIPSIYAIFITEMLKSPATQILDIVGNVKKHLMAPRAPTLKKVSKYFRGTTYDLSERYTDMCSVVFMAFVYSLLFPAGYFLAAATLGIHYWVDKFCLLRVWCPAPKMGFQIGRISRDYFFRLALLVYAMKSSYDYASFPFDDACELSEQVPDSYAGSFNATDGRGNSITINIPNDDQSYKLCNQDIGQFRDFPPILFATPARQPDGGEWMSEDQQFSYVFGTTSFWAMIVALFSLCNCLRKQLQILFWRPFTRKEWSSPKPFSSIEDESGYIPSANVETEMFPVLFCDVSDLPMTMMSWFDPENPDYKQHCALYDIPGLEKRPCFSTVHYWSPDGVEKKDSIEEMN